MLIFYTSTDLGVSYQVKETFSDLESALAYINKDEKTRIRTRWFVTDSTGHIIWVCPIFEDVANETDQTQGLSDDKYLRQYLKELNKEKKRLSREQTSS
jgi:hypothetical protein